MDSCSLIALWTRRDPYTNDSILSYRDGTSRYTLNWFWTNNALQVLKDKHTFVDTVQLKDVQKNAPKLSYGPREK